MTRYYALAAQIRYYGQVPTTVEKIDGAVRGTGVKSVIFGKNILTVDWPSLLETATDEPFDLTHRKEPVHVTLANLMLNLESLHYFSRMWGFLDADVDHSGRLLTRPEHVRPFQTLLQRAWKGNSAALREMRKNLKTRVDVGPKGIGIAIVDLWNLVRFLFLRDHATCITKLCANPDCCSPYFVQQRRGQKYCTHKCAVLINVRRFREQEAKAKAKSRPKKKGGTK
jgi:hypothetical protein